MRTLAIIFFGFIATSLASDDVNSYFNAGHLKYQVGLLRDFGNNRLSMCGGVLVDPYLVLTTAHCLVGAQNVRLITGRTDIPEQMYEMGSDIVDSSNFRIHENYRSGSSVDDIATIILVYPILYPNVEKIAIATRNSNCGQGKAWVSAWDSGMKVVSFASTDAVSNYDCGRAHYGFMSDKQICSSAYQAKSMCGLESRVPLVFEDYNGKLVLCGLSTFPEENCYAGDPGLFTRVSHYFENGWICANSYETVGC